jgi:ATP-dependent Clp protease ATP-binding subunit ClpB
MKAHWDQEKALIQNIRKIKEDQEQVGIEEQKAEREGNLARVAELRYGKAIELVKQLERPTREIGRAAKRAQDAQGRGR